MKTPPKRLILALLALFVFSCFLPLHSVKGQTTSADSKIQAANESVNKAFTDVAAAETAGANVTSLLNQLNVAEFLLAHANVALRRGDSATAMANAGNAILITQQVSSSAAAAESNAGIAGGVSAWFWIEFSVIGSVVFVLGLFLVWVRFKNYYVKKLSDAKPELTQK